MELTKSLYQIREEHLALLSIAEESEGDLTEELANALYITQEDFDKKAVSYAFVLKSFDNGIEQIDQEIERLKNLKEKAEKRQSMIKNRLSVAMDEFGIEKLQTPTLSLSFRKSEAVEIEDPDLIPSAYTFSLTEKKIIKSRIKEALKQGQDVPGAKLITNKNLQIK